jgi:hypothetical protein
MNEVMSLLIQTGHFEKRVSCRIILYPGFIDEERCAHFVKLAKARLAPSALALRQTDEDQVTE